MCGDILDQVDLFLLIVQFDVYNLLSTHADLDCWITWLKGIVHRFLRIPAQQHPQAVGDFGPYLFDAYDDIHPWCFFQRPMTIRFMPGNLFSSGHT